MVADRYGRKGKGKGEGEGEGEAEGEGEGEVEGEGEGEGEENSPPPTPAPSPTPPSLCRETCSLGWAQFRCLVIRFVFILYSSFIFFFTEPIFLSSKY